MGRLDGRTAIVTGGASGIGEATVRLFVEEGANVVVADRQDDAGRHLAEQLGDRARFAHTDVTQESDVQAAVDLAVSAFGRLDCMFNNAGITGPNHGIDTIPMEEFDFTIAVNVGGVLLGMKCAARVMKAQGSGTIISTSSLGGMRTGYGGHAYSASKAAVIHLTHSVAMELCAFGVRVNCIVPGAIVTPLFGTAAGLPPDEAVQSVEKVKRIMRSPLGRPGTPEDIARAALWLASDDSSFVTGETLVVDAGVSCGQTWEETVRRYGQMAAALNPALQGDMPLSPNTR